jgi:leader peptidase (prepilin peptidase)/N-methyltransferase
MEIREVIFYLIFIITGLAVGSFLEVVIYRIPRRLSIVRPPSYCPNCKKKIAFYDNIPVLSYIILRGRCRNCKAKIPFTSLLVEILAPLLFAVNYMFFGLSIDTAIGIVFCCALLAISFIDIEFQIIPNVIVLPLTAVGLTLSIASDISNWWMPLAFSTGAFLFMLIIHLIYPRGMGMGDVKLSLMVGAFLVRNVVSALFIGFLLGSVYGISLIIIKRKKLKQAIPFGPFIALGSITSLFWGNNILKWYISFFR